MSTKEKKQLLATFIEKHVQCGYSIVEYMGKPLFYFDFEKVEARIKWIPLLSSVTIRRMLLNLVAKVACSRKTQKDYGIRSYVAYLFRFLFAYFLLQSKAGQKNLISSYPIASRIDLLFSLKK